MPNMTEPISNSHCANGDEIMLDTSYNKDEEVLVEIETAKVCVDFIRP